MRQTLVLAEYLRGRWPSMSAMVVAGTRAVLGLRWPETLELVKLPSRVRLGRDVPYASPSLAISGAELWKLREEMLLSVARHFPPDLMLVDHTPAGPVGELRAALRQLKTRSPATRFVLGLIDVVFEAPRLRLEWSRDDAYGVLDELYDRILVYGQRDVCDLEREAGLSPAAAAKVRYTGYLRRGVQPGEPERVRRALGLRTDRLVLATVGGGDAGGERVLRCMLEALQLAGQSDAFDCVLVGGPLLTERERTRLGALVPRGGPVRFLDAVPDLAPYVAAADVVVSRAGYNTVCEILSFRRPAVLVPLVRLRDGVGSQEQLLRAQALRERGLAQMIHPSELTPRRLLAEVRGLLERQPVAPRSVNLDGLPAVAAELEALLA